MKTIKYTSIVIVITAIIVLVLNTQGSTHEYKRPEVGTSTQVQVEVSNDVEKARKQLEEATNKLKAEEDKILAETEAASTTAHAEIAKIMAEFESIKSENDKKLEEINKVRSSF